MSNFTMETGSIHGGTRTPNTSFVEMRDIQFHYADMTNGASPA